MFEIHVEPIIASRREGHHSIVNHNLKAVDKDAANYSNQTILCTESWPLDQTRCGSLADSIHIKPQGPEGTCPLSWVR